MATAQHTSSKSVSVVSLRILKTSSGVGKYLKVI